jgi:putative ABC transport system permease protein
MEETTSLPKWAERFLRAICPEDLYEEIEGDLIQRHNKNVGAYGQSRAKRILLADTIRYLRPEIILRNKFSTEITRFPMIRHFMLTFFRGTRRSFGYTFINVFGLCLGLVCFIFITLWVYDEMTFDSSHADKEKIYQVMGRHTYPDGTFVDSGMPGPLATALTNLSGIDASGRITFVNSKVLFQYQNKSLYENGTYADPSILNIFNLNILEGDFKNPLAGSNSIIISKDLADKYFGTESAVGKVISINKELQTTVNAVFEPLPSNSTLKFDFILPYQVYAKNDTYNDEWGAWTGGLTFIKVADVSSAIRIEKQINEKFTKPHIWLRWDSNVELFLFPMSDWHLYANFNNGVQDGGRIDYVKTFIAVAFFILAIACINFTNLATARAMKRAKEIGVRKVVGARRSSLFFQFLFESMLVTGVSIVLALIIVTISLPAFNNFTGKQIEIPYASPLFYGAIFGIWCISTLLAGSYPAIVLSASRGLDAMKGTSISIKGVVLRKGLVVFQFALSVTLIVCALVAFEQIEFIRAKSLGFDRDNLLYFDAQPALINEIESFKNEASQNPIIRSVAIASTSPMNVASGMVLSDNAWQGKSKDDNIVFRWMQCDQDYLATLGFKLLEGRWFSKENISDSSNYVINEEAVRQMKLKEPIGATLLAPHPGKIIGVVKDFHSTKLQFKIQPVIMAMKPVRISTVFIRYEKEKMSEAVAYIESLHKKFEPDHPFEWKTMDDQLQVQYKEELFIRNLAICFTVVALVISCLGLTGLATYLTENRVKEIGIRKVVGASTFNLIEMLLRDFIALVSLGFAMGALSGWFVSEHYLKDYAFRFEMNAWIFLWTGVVLIVITLLSVSYQSGKAAMANPVKTLKAN